MQKHRFLAAMLLILIPTVVQALEFPEGEGAVLEQSNGGSDLHATLGLHEVRLFYGGYALGYNFLIDGVAVLRIGADTRTAAAQQISLDEQIFVTPLGKIPDDLKVSYSQGRDKGSLAQRLYVGYINSDNRIEMIVFLLPAVFDMRATDVNLSFTREVGW
jgi:hypothetical protein